MKSIDQYKEDLRRLRDAIEDQPFLLDYIDVKAFNQMAEDLGSPFRLVEPDENHEVHP